MNAAPCFAYINELKYVLWTLSSNGKFAVPIIISDDVRLN
jgi:hypothetical protein